MKRPAYGIALVLLVVIGALGFSNIFPTYSYRYRLTVSIGVDGQTHTGSSVIEVAWVGQPEFAMGRFHPQVRGQAAYIDLGSPRAVVAILTAPAQDVRGIIQWPYGVNAIFLAAQAFGNASTYEDIPKLVRLRGRRDLTGENMPALIWLSDIADPKSARRLKTGEITSVLGPSAQITAHVEITSDPIVIDIDRKLPWYAELAKRQKGRLVVGRPDEFQLVYSMFVGDER